MDVVVLAHVRDCVAVAREKKSRQPLDKSDRGAENGDQTRSLIRRLA